MLQLPESFKNTKFADIDTNNSGTITFGEFRGAILKASPKAADDAIFNLFQKYNNLSNEKNQVTLAIFSRF